MTQTLVELLPLMTWGAVGLTALLVVWAVREPGGRSSPLLVHWAAALTVGPMLGSLWLSEAVGFPPCELCWVQRLLVYPVAVLLVWDGVTGGRALPLLRRLMVASLLAATATSLWHVGLERSWWAQAQPCDLTASCTAIWIDQLGLTIPGMAGLLSLSAALCLSLWRPAASASEPDPVPAGETQR